MEYNVRPKYNIPPYPPGTWLRGTIIENNTFKQSKEVLLFTLDLVVPAYMQSRNMLESKLMKAQAAYRLRPAGYFDIAYILLNTKIDLLTPVDVSEATMLNLSYMDKLMHANTNLSIELIKSFRPFANPTTHPIIIYSR
jgi:hypothetical protein